MVQNFYGIKFKWDYTTNNRSVIIEIPNFIDNLLTTIGHPKPRRQQHTPYKYTNSYDPTASQDTQNPTIQNN